MARKKIPLELKLIALILLVFGVYKGVQSGRAHWREKNDSETVSRLVAAEELILELNSELRKLNRSALDLQLPAHDASKLFAQRVTIVDVEMPSSSGETFDGVAVEIRDWSLADPAEATSPDRVSLWRPLLAEISYFEHAKFYFVDGHFSNDTFDEFETNVGFVGLAKLKSGGWSGVRAKQKLSWRRLERAESAESAESAGERSWRITGWKTISCTSTIAERLLFSDVTRRALPDAKDLQLARKSLHQKATISYYESGGRQLPSKYFAPIAGNLKPGLTVVDLDRNGFDDLYVMVRTGRNLFLHNRGDGTFTEVAEKLGLDIQGDTTCAIFADFDNDGDPDAMLGRSLQRSLYLENVDGHFVPRPENSEILPYLAVSMSAADYNGDGLLDVYISTYRPAILEQLVSSGQDRQTPQGIVDGSPMGGVARESQKWPDEFLDEDQATEFYRRRGEKLGENLLFGSVLDQVGPPNVLLVNRGNGRFEKSPEGAALELWANTLQATWADFDGDGDPDVYVANDWAYDSLLRNDGDAGFVDIAREKGITSFGFGMGVSWGDYDRDGRQDLYVSNMFSKAGSRITSRLADIDPAIVESASGNFLYRQSDDGFDLVSGLAPPALAVADGGWAWGGQFSDIDNDGFLDIHVLSGYFTAPAKFATNIDL